MIRHRVRSMLKRGIMWLSRKACAYMKLIKCLLVTRLFLFEARAREMRARVMLI